MEKKRRVASTKKEDAPILAEKSSGRGKKFR